jgi:hypothetical protein
MEMKVQSGCSSFIFKKKIVLFGGPELYNELLEGVNLIIQNYQRRR